jgi:hypothetical protein
MQGRLWHSIGLSVYFAKIQLPQYRHPDRGAVRNSGSAKMFLMEIDDQGLTGSGRRMLNFRNGSVAGPRVSPGAESQQDFISSRLEFYGIDCILLGLFDCRGLWCRSAFRSRQAQMGILLLGSVLSDLSLALAISLR